jgi:hypothetical protein
MGAGIGSFETVADCRSRLAFRKEKAPGLLGQGLDK